MEKLSENKYPLVRQESDGKKIVLPGYPASPTGEDIYNQAKEEAEIDPEQLGMDKENEEYGVSNEKNFMDDSSGNDLDVPGSELDDNEEETGNEDEENNLYSLGGDNHDD